MVGYQGQRLAGLNAASYDSAARTAEAVLSAGSTVRRSYFSEELEISVEAIDLGRAQAGLVCLLDCHNQFEASAVLGTVSNARIRGGQLVGTLKFGETERAREVEGMVARGELRGISIGYRVSKWEIASVENDHETWRATRWELLEVSLVSVPADVHASVRSEAAAAPSSQLEDEEMFTRNDPGSAAAPAQPAGAPASVTRFTTTSALDFVGLARELGVEDAAAELVRRNERGEVGVEAARDAILRAAGERQRADTATAHGGGAADHNGRTFDNPAFHSRAIEDALYSRLSGRQPTEEARQFRGLSMAALAADMLARAGVRDVHRLSAPEVLNAAAWNNSRSAPRDVQFARLGALHTTSDFPDLLTAAGNRHLLDQFAAAATVIKAISRERTAADFREISGLQLSAFGRLPEVLESGEIQRGTFQASKETYRVKTFAKIFGLTRQAIINDDLDAFGQATTIMARAAAEEEGQLFAELINSNLVMSDNVALFHATHANLAASGAAPSVTTLSAGRLAMRSQKDFDGVTPLACAPRYILASPKRETEIEQLLVATIAPTSSDETNPFNGKLTPLIDPRLTADPWYLFADPSSAPVLEHAYLEGKSGPTVEMKDGWDVLGTEFRVYMDFGAGVVDHRGGYKNPGA